MKRKLVGGDHGRRGSPYTNAGCGGEREIMMKVTRLALAATLTMLASCGDGLTGSDLGGTISVSGRITWEGEPVLTTVHLWHFKSVPYGSDLPVLWWTLRTVNTNADGTYALEAQVEACGGFDGQAYLRVEKIGPTDGVGRFPDSGLRCGQHTVNFFWTSDM